MLKFLLPGAALTVLVSAVAFAPATAVAAPTAPLLSEPKSGAPAGVEKVAEWNEWNGRRYRAGRRYREAPPHWHRYHRRPRDWYGRGCIVVGPLWFCP
jgi:hypothetical protein